MSRTLNLKRVLCSQKSKLLKVLPNVFDGCYACDITLQGSLSTLVDRGLVCFCATLVDRGLALDADGGHNINSHG